MTRSHPGRSLRRAATCRRRRRLLRLGTIVVAALSGALLIVACGSSSGSSSSRTSTLVEPATPIPPDQPSAPTTASRQLFFRYSQGPRPTLSDAAVEAKRYGVVILQGPYWQLAKQLHAAYPGVKVLLYKAVTETNQEPDVLSDRYRTTIVDYAEALRDHPDWLLKDAQGNPITRPYGGGTDHLVDVGSRSLQEQTYETMLRQIRADGWDGVFFDDVLPTLRFWLPDGRVSDVARYPSDAAWSAATRSYLAAVGPRLQADGLLVVANTGLDLIYHQRADWASLLSGTMDEGFLTQATSHTDPLATGAEWRGYLNEVVQGEASGKILLEEAPGLPNQTARMRYALATFMLGWNGRGSRFQYHMDDSASTWSAEENSDAMRLGAPLGSYRQLSDGTYQRFFAHGQALVDPRPAGAPPILMNLGAAYSGFGLAHVDRVTLTSGTGYILLKD